MELNSKIYVAWHRWLVWSAIVRRFQNLWYSNLILRIHSELDLLDYAAIKSFFGKEKLENVFLVVARVWWIVSNNTYLAEHIYENLQIQNNKYQAQNKWTFLMLSIKNVHFHHIKKLLTYHRLWHYPASFQLSSVGAKDFQINKKIVYSYLQERVPEKDLTYIINIKNGFFKWKTKYWIIPIWILVLLKYPKASIACVKYVLFKIKAALF